MRYLTREQAATNVRLGKTVEQYLGERPVEGLSVVHWVNVRRRQEDDYEDDDEDEEAEEGEGEDGGKPFVVTLYRGRPPGPDDEDLRDLYDLWALEVDQDRALQPVDAAGKRFFFDDEEQALDFVASDLGGSADRFLNEGFVTDDYNERRKSP